MEWLITLFQKPDSIAHAVLVISMVAAFGLALGSIRFWGISLGIGGVLFSGLLFGHFKINVDFHTLEFVREFGLILFVYSIGMQVGPGFFSSLKRQGLKLNIMATAIVLMGVLIAVGLNYYGHIEKPVAVGLYAGAVTNTPALAASQQALKDELENKAEKTPEQPVLPPVSVSSTVSATTTAALAADSANAPVAAAPVAAGNGHANDSSSKQGTLKKPGLGYAVAYPFGIIGIILTMIIIRFLFRVDPLKEAEDFKKTQTKAVGLSRLNVEVTNPNLEGILLEKIPGLEDSGVVISRIKHQNKVEVAQPDTVIHTGDILLCVGQKDKLDAIRIVIGKASDVDLMKVQSNLITKRLIVTNKKVLGKQIEELDFLDQYDVVITRISRAEIEYSPNSDVELSFGDTVLAVGTEENIAKITPWLGNSLRSLNHPEVIPVLVGIALGVILGSFPIYFPGMPAPVKLGLAGGPLVVAIILSRLGRIGPLVWYLPMSANFMIRELGIVLFLTAVGLISGDKFVETLVQGDGLYWMALSTLITFIPIFIVALVAKAIYKMNYLTICGVLAGSMTDPPALAFATGIVPHSDAPNVSYATVYPLVMLLRVLSAQIMVLFLLH